jgi:hypothetical protein
MRFRALVLVTAVACFSQAIPVEAARPRRVIRPYHYTDENHHAGTPVNSTGVWNMNDAYSFPLRKGDKAVEVMVLDDNERPVAGAIVQTVWDYQEGGAMVGHSVTRVEFCGQTEAPVPVEPDITVEIRLQKGTCNDGTPSLPVEGDIVVDFFKS